MLVLGARPRGFVSLSCSICLASRRRPLIRYAYSALILVSCKCIAFAVSRSSSAIFLHSVLGFMTWGQYRKHTARCPLCRVPSANLIWNELRSRLHRHHRTAPYVRTGLASRAHPIDGFFLPPGVATGSIICRRGAIIQGRIGTSEKHPVIALTLGNKGLLLP